MFVLLFIVRCGHIFICRVIFVLVVVLLLVLAGGCRSDFAGGV